MNTTIYIDADNVSYKFIDDIINKSKQYNVISKKIYADWTQENMKKWAERAKRHGFEGIQCFGNNFKQTSDIYMVTDIINDIYSNNYLDCIILATSDIDFTRLCQIVKIKNKKLIIFTPQKSSLSNMSENSSLLKNSKKRKHIDKPSDFYSNNNFSNVKEEFLTSKEEFLTSKEEYYSNDSINNYFGETVESEGNDDIINKLDLLKIPFENCNVMNISKYKKKLKKIMKNFTINYKFDLNHVDVELKKYPKYFGVIRKKGAFKIIALYHLHKYSKKDIRNEWIDSSHHEILHYYSPEKLISILN